MYHLPRRSKTAERAAFVAAAGQRAEGERRGEARRGSEADVSGERPVRDFPLRQASILVPVDGSKVSEDAVRYVIGLARSGMSMRVHLLNVQPEAASRSDYEKREALALQIMAADQATEGARALLAGASLDFERHFRIGAAAEVIARLARQKRCHKIVMGTRRLNTLAGFLLGSVASRVLRLTAVPVTLVREN